MKILLDIRSICGNISLADAGIAHPVERHLAKVEVASSSLVARSIQNLLRLQWVFFIRGYGGIGRHAGFRFQWATVQVQVLLPAPEKGHPKGCPFSGAAPSARKDPLRSNAKEDSRPLSRSSHADLRVDSDLDCPGAPRRNKAIRSCGGTCTATTTNDLVSPFQPRPADAGLAPDYGAGSDLDCDDTTLLRSRSVAESRLTSTMALAFCIGKAYDSHQ